MAAHIPLPSPGATGERNDQRATATCFCGAVQLSFPTEPPGLVTSLLCNCADCHKISASMFASVFIVAEDRVEHLRGRELLTLFATNKTTLSGSTMSNYFCSVCGSLMYRISSNFSGQLFMRIGTVDDFNLHATKLKPQVEMFTKDRVDWLEGGKDILQSKGDYFSTIGNT